MPIEDIKDIKPPLDVPSGYLGWIVLALAVILAMGFYIWRRYQKNKKPILPSKTIWEIACEQLAHLEKQDLISRGHWKEYYSRLSDIVRHYIEERFNIRAPEMTTEEFLRSLDSSASITNVQKGILRDFLESCDLVKFAKHVPLREEAGKALEIVRKFVEETMNKNS